MPPPGEDTELPHLQRNGSDEETNEDRKLEDEQKDNPQLVKITKLKELRTKLKLKITNTAKRLTKCIASDLNCKDIAADLEKSMTEFNEVHDEYCFLIECYDLNDFKVVNGLDLEAYQNVVDDTFQEAMVQFNGHIKQIESSKLKQQAKVQVQRLKGICDNFNSTLKSSLGDPNVIDSCKREIEYLSDELLQLMSHLGSMKVDYDDLETQVNSVVVQADEIRRQCVSSTVYTKHEVHSFDNESEFKSSGFRFKELQTSNTVLSPPGTQPSSSNSDHCKTSLQQSTVSETTDRPKSEKLPQIHFKKTPLPEFSGQRHDWPEFKAVWRELAESTLENKSLLAFELKRSVKGIAKQKIKHIYITKPGAYDLMWERLCDYYDDIGASVQCALDGLAKLKPVREEDFKGLVGFVDAVESAYSQLEELGQLEALSMKDIDKIVELLPNSVRMMWIRQYHKLDSQTKIKPLSPFMQFLFAERAAVSRLAESNRKVSSNSNFSLEKAQSEGSSRRVSCAFHKDQGNTKHSTSDCKEFKRLPLDDKYQHLRSVHACFNCLGMHRRDKCPSKSSCKHCGRMGHHFLLCRKPNSPSDVDKSKSHVATAVPNSMSTPPLSLASTSDHLASSCSNFARNADSMPLYAIHDVFVTNSGKMATLFCDNGSNTSYITHSAADRLHAKRLDRYTLSVTTMGNLDTEYDTTLYEISVRTTSGRVTPITAFGMNEITGPVSKLDEVCLANLFPNYDVSLLQRKSRKVDVLLGCDYFGLHPKHEIHKAGEHLSIMQGELGVCIQGHHPELKENTQFASNMVKAIHEFKIKADCNHVARVSHPEFCMPQVASVNNDSFVWSSSMFCKTDALNFISGEEMVTETNPRCGSCKCGKCPIVGHSYSFKEEQELFMIRDNLRYDSLQKCWTTSYPWLVDPVDLPDNYHVALATLKSTEHTLKKDPEWASKYKDQIKDMLDRKVARRLSGNELKNWDGPTFHISHLAVRNPNSKSTPVRIVFNSSQPCNGVSLNSALAKGPDNYINNLVGLLLRWREDRTAFVGDIKKMFNSVHLEPLEQHCHRFLWRDLEESKKPGIYVMTRVNMGDRPAPAISTEALYKTAEQFEADSPAAATVLRKSSYVDDLIDSVADHETALQVTGEVEKMLAKGGFQIKCWQYSGEGIARSSSNSSDGVSLLKGTDENTRVLGVVWDPVSDCILFHVVLNFSKKRKGVRIGPNLTAADVPSRIPDVLTRRLVLEQVMSIFDPLGFLCPFTLLAKVYLRETWARNLGWDDMLPTELRGKWMEFFTSLFELQGVKFPRCLKPENAVGKPCLIIMSDGSDIAYGFVAYIRWTLDNGGFWCRLILAKCRIAPMSKLSTPQMELNAALLSKRGRKVIESEMRFDFDKVYHIVDSETVLCMINKTSTRFKVYEGVRIGEIQAATNGNMKDWAWMSGKCNTADWLTRGRVPSELNENSEWWNGPEILYQPMSEWGLKFGLSKNEILPGEKKLTTLSASHATEAHVSSFIDYSRFSSIRHVYWVIARIVSIFRFKSFRGGRSVCVTPQILQHAENLVIKDIQGTMKKELSKISKQGAVGGKYSALKPIQDGQGLWVVGTRLNNFNPMTFDSNPQKLLPYDHSATQLIMQEAHKNGHRGRNGTLAKFRESFWTPNGSKLAWQAKNKCQLCKLRSCQLLEQTMGQLPEARLKPSPPFCYSMVDFFGPYLVRGEVQKRTSGKAYGVIFTDLTMRAVHIEPVFGYDTSSFLMALMRFVSIRGWPSVIYSDPGTQFVAADNELKKVWNDLDKTAIIRKSTENGLEWKMGPADSPWQQGAVESLVKAAKKAISFSVNNQRLSASEYMTLCAEISNLINERPIGTIPGNDCEISLLTPNSLLLGRASAKNPGGWQPQSTNLSDRYHLVQNVADFFWKKWIELCAPSLIVQRKWHRSSRNLQPGDVVLVMDQNSLRGVYKLGLVREVFPGRDGFVRKVSISYKNFKIGEKVYEYSGAKDTVITRSVQRLALLVPVDFSDS